MYRLGVDLGGTNIAVGVVDENYNIVCRASEKTPKGVKAYDLCTAIGKAVFAALEKGGLSLSQISFAGIGVPGSVNKKSGEVYFAPNLELKNVALSSLLREAIGIDFSLENDANAAALGEMLAGCGRGASSLVMITLGTGVGGGIVIDRKIVSGFNGVGAELGHMVIKSGGEACNCGRKGCFEAYASVSALIRETKKAAQENPDSAINTLCGGNLSNIDGKSAFEALKLGDSAAKEVLEAYFDYIAEGTANILNIFQPEVLCIGGSISREGENLLSPIRSRVERHDFAKGTKNRTKILAASLFGDAGIIGAAFAE